MKKFVPKPPVSKRAALPPNLVSDFQARKQGYEGGYKEGYENGYRQATHDAGRLAYRSIYGAIILSLHEQFGFGKQRLYKVLAGADQRVLEAIHHQELVDEAFEKTGLQLNFDAPFDRIEQVDEE